MTPGGCQVSTVRFKGTEWREPWLAAGSDWKEGWWVTQVLGCSRKWSGLRGVSYRVSQRPLQTVTA